MYQYNPVDLYTRRVLVSFEGVISVFLSVAGRRLYAV